MEKYPILSGVSGFLKFVGWTILVISGISLFVGLLKLITGEPLQIYEGVWLIGGSLSLSLVSLIAILIGEAGRVFVDVENNTARAADFLRVLASQEIPILSSGHRDSTSSPSPNTNDSTPTPTADRPRHPKPIPPGFEQYHRRLRVNDRVFYPTNGEGVVVGPGKDRYFVFVRFDGESEDREMESFGLYLRQ